jgi:hypothetical protein
VFNLSFVTFELLPHKSTHNVSHPHAISFRQNDYHTPFFFGNAYIEAFLERVANFHLDHCTTFARRVKVDA